jgi:hypothetical protein
MQVDVIAAPDDLTQSRRGARGEHSLPAVMRMPAELRRVKSHKPAERFDRVAVDHVVGRLYRVAATPSTGALMRVVEEGGRWRGPSSKATTGIAPKG